MPFRSFSSLKILIVDSNARDVLLLQDMLQVAGHVAHKGLTDTLLAPQLFRSYQPDLLILALQDDFSMLDELQENIDSDDYRPILVLLERDDSSLKRRALRHGATDFIMKPLDHTDAMLRIGNLLHSRFLHLQHMTTQQAPTQKTPTRL